jgi:dienelactone hydrolase
MAHAESRAQERIDVSYLWYWPAGGWDFDKWKAERHPPPALASIGTANAVLVPTTPEEWLSQRDLWRQATDALLGTVTDSPPTRMRWEVLGDALQCNGNSGAVSLQRLRYTLTDEEWGYAWLLRPVGDDKVLRPAVLALHQTVPQGKLEPIGIEGNPELAYGRELAEQGFVVLAPDAIGFGERQSGHANALYRSSEQFFAAHPDGSVMAKMAYDTRRAVDLLEQLPGVDAGRVGCIGHSHGGYGTLFAMLYDERIRTSVVSCGITLLNADPTPERWWRRTALIPRLGFFEGRIAESPVDFGHWVALLAPRPLFVGIALNDAIFPNTAPVPHALEFSRGAYRAMNAPADALSVHAFAGAHRFPAEVRETAYTMLNQVLRSP